MTTLQVLSFLSLGGLLVGYAILDGFDLGVGFWSMFTRKDEEKRSLLNSIGPVWDGNEVWLVTAGVVMFGAFPPVYASVFSGMYLAVMLLLVALVARAVSIEFRSQVENPRWRAGWDRAFGLGSTGVALLLGVALGNMLHGFPLDAGGNYTGGFFGLLNPYSLLIGFLAVAMLAVHGALWIKLKTSNDLERRAEGWARTAWVAYASLWLVGGLVTVLWYRPLIENYLAGPIFFLVPLLAAGAIAGIRWALGKGKTFTAFMLSAASIALNLSMVGISLFPNLVRSAGALENSLTIYNSSASEYALGIVLLLVAAGMPVVLAYTFFVYRSFRGKIDQDKLVY